MKGKKEISNKAVEDKQTAKNQQKKAEGSKKVTKKGRGEKTSPKQPSKKKGLISVLAIVLSAIIFVSALTLLIVFLKPKNDNTHGGNDDIIDDGGDDNTDDGGDDNTDDGGDDNTDDGGDTDDGEGEVAKSISGDFSFNATDLNADITGSVSGTKTPVTLSDINITPSLTQEQITLMATGWKNLTLDFTEDNLITITITITNKAQSNNLKIDFTDSTNQTDLNMTRKITSHTWNSDSGDYQDTVTNVSGKFEGNIEIPSGTESAQDLTKYASVTIEISISVSGDEANLEESKLSLGMTLSKIEVAEEPVAEVLDESEYTTLLFDYDEANKTAKVYGNSSNYPSGELVLPSAVKHNDEVYTVTAIKSYGFYNAPSRSITKVTIPASIIEIGEYSFGSLDSAIFENPNGWQYYDTDDGNRWKDISPRFDLSIPSEASHALHLNSGVDGKGCYNWRRVDE